MRDGHQTTATGPSAVRWAVASLLGLVVAALHATWVLGLPFQLDDYFVLRDPWLGFSLRDGHVGDDLPAFMCRIPQWVLWGLVEPLAGEPLSPVPFHLVGLALHGLVVALVARLAGRFFGRWPALVGAALGGLAAGGMQAVSWTAAWSSLTYTLFGAAGLELAFVAATTSGARVWFARAFAATCLALVIVSKAPAIVVPAVVLVLFVEGRARLAPRAGAFVDVAFLLGGSLAGWLVREWFLGASDLGYYEKATPSLVEVARRLPLGLQGLGQALYPWNADPLVEDVAPLLARLTGRAVPAWWLAALVFGVPTLAALVTARRGRVLVLLVALAPAILPLTMLYEGSATNVAGREAYLPVPLAILAWCAACLAVRERWRAVGTAALVVGGLVVVDGSVHVARTERAMGRHVDHVLALGREVLAVDAPTVLAVQHAGGGFAGIPALGEHVQLALAPPFAPPSEVAVLADERPERLLDAFHRGAIPTTSAFAFLHERAPSSSTCSSLRPGIPEARATELFSAHFEDDPDGQLRFDPPLPRHAISTVRWKSGPSTSDAGPTALALVSTTGQLVDEFRLPNDVVPGKGRCEIPTTLATLAGEPLVELRVLTSGACRPTGVWLPVPAYPPIRTPEGELLGFAERAPDVALDPERPPRAFGYESIDPPMLLAWPYESWAPEFGLERWARLEFRLLTPQGERIELYSDVNWASADPELLRFHTDGDARTRPEELLPWSVLVTEHLRPALERSRLRDLRFEVTATVRWRDTGLVLERYPLQRGRFVLPEHTP